MLCVSCKLIIVQKQGDVCKTCAPSASRHSPVREARMAAQLGAWANQGLLPAVTRWNKSNPQADPVQSGLYRVDFVFESQCRVVALEYDERMHADRDRRCELVRMGKASVGYGGRPVHWVRFNPDAFKVGDATRRTVAKERDAVLLRVLQEAVGRMDMPVDDGPFMTIDYVCYDNDKPSAQGELVQTHCFRTIEDYCVWVDGCSSTSVSASDSASASSGVGVVLPGATGTGGSASISCGVMGGHRGPGVFEERARGVGEMDTEPVVEIQPCPAEGAVGDPPCAAVSVGSTRLADEDLARCLSSFNHAP